MIHFLQPTLNFGKSMNILVSSLRKNGITQNHHDDFSKSKRTYSDCSRSLTAKMFYRQISNGEKVRRCWLVYSVSQGKVFRSVCRLFGPTSTTPSSFELMDLMSGNMQKNDFSNLKLWSTQVCCVNSIKAISRNWHQELSYFTVRSRRSLLA